MASNRKRNEDNATVKAVLAYAGQLRDRADAAQLLDPHVELYRPSNDAARKVSQQFGPAEALRVLARRAREAELRSEEANERAKQGHLRLVSHQLAAAGARDAELAQLSLGQRLDVALLGLSTTSEVSAVRLDSEPVSGSRGGSALPFRRRREVELLEGDAVHLVERCERELARSRRRLIETEAA